jgi:hypothetical protein
VDPIVDPNVDPIVDPQVARHSLRPSPSTAHAEPPGQPALVQSSAQRPKRPRFAHSPLAQSASTSAPLPSPQRAPMGRGYPAKQAAVQGTPPGAAVPSPGPTAVGRLRQRVPVGQVLSSAQAGRHTGRRHAEAPDAAAADGAADEIVDGDAPAGVVVPAAVAGLAEAPVEVRADRSMQAAPAPQSPAAPVQARAQKPRVSTGVQGAVASHQQVPPVSHCASRSHAPPAWTGTTCTYLGWIRLAVPAGPPADTATS